MATREITSLVCDLHDGEEGAVPVWLGIGGQLYQLDVCPQCAAPLREVLGPFLTHARRAGAVPGWLPRPDAPAGRTVEGPTPKRDLILSVLRARIADGTYPAGSYLPAQRDLAGEHGMSVTPVSHACWQLERDGLIRGTDGGRYIIEPAASRRRNHHSDEAASHAARRAAQGNSACAG
jgi:DNA-binding transcriptional regulator YhcF (GntR family)